MVHDATLHQLSLSRDEYALIVERLGREPNEVELGMFGALWSEHCGYKNSRPLLRLLPTQGEHVLTKAGEENADAERIARSRYLFGGVVAGIGGYGNTLGLPTVGGETYFEPSYAENPLVNAMCIG